MERLVRNVGGRTGRTRCGAGHGSRDTGSVQWRAGHAEEAGRSGGSPMPLISVPSRRQAGVLILPKAVAAA